MSAWAATSTPIGIEGFEHYDGGSSQCGGIQGVGQLHGAICGFGSELRFSGDFRTVYQEGSPLPLFMRTPEMV